MGNVDINASVNQTINDGGYFNTYQVVGSEIDFTRIPVDDVKPFLDLAATALQPTDVDGAAYMPADHYVVAADLETLLNIDLTASLTTTLEDPVNGPLLGTSIIAVISGEAIAAKIIFDLSLEERLQWLADMSFDSELMVWPAGSDLTTAIIAILDDPVNGPILAAEILAAIGEEGLVYDLTASLTAELVDVTNGPVLASAIVNAIGGDAIAAKLLADLDSSERLVWFNSIYDLTASFTMSLEDETNGPLLSAAIIEAIGGSALDITTSLTAALVHVTDGPIIAAAIVDAVGGDAIAAVLLEDLDPAERLAWFASMFDSEVVSWPTVADVRAGTVGLAGVTPDVLAASQAPNILTATAGVLAPDGLNSFIFKHTLTANITDCNPINLIPGIGYQIRFEQGGAGNFTIAFGLNTAGNREIGIPAPAIAPAVGKVAYYTIVNHGTVGSPLYDVLPGPRDA